MTFLTSLAQGDDIDVQGSDWLEPSGSNHGHKYWARLNEYDTSIREAYFGIVARIKAFDPVSCSVNWRTFQYAQFGFHAHTVPLYSDPVIRRMCLGLPNHGRVFTFHFQTCDIGDDLGSRPSGRTNLPGGLMQRLGWLYVAEWIFRSSAVLMLAMQRNLPKKYEGKTSRAEQADNGKRQWRIFDAKLDQLHMSESEAERFYSGARAALAFAEKYMIARFEQSPEKCWPELK